MASAGYRQYEISAYARDGRRSAHNLNYWQFGDYLGIGAGAHGKVTIAGENRVLRRVRKRQPRQYLAAQGHDRIANETERKTSCTMSAASCSLISRLRQ